MMEPIEENNNLTPLRTVLFFADILQCEYDIDTTLHRLYQGINYEVEITKNPAALLRSVQDLTRNFNLWKGNIETLSQKGKELAPLHLSDDKMNQSHVLKALCGLQTQSFHMKEGDKLMIMDASHPYSLKVRNESGEEGYVPALCCILPSPDKNAITAIERLRVQLLAAWVEGVKKVKRLMMECLIICSRQLTNDWRTQVHTGSSMTKERIARRFRRLTDTINKTAPNFDLTKLHNALFSLERELTTWNLNGSDVSNIIDNIASLDKSVLCYQMFSKQLYLYRKNLERAPRPIQVIEDWDKLKLVKRGKKFRYFEMKMVLEELETVEEVYEIVAKKQQKSIMATTNKNRRAIRHASGSSMGSGRGSVGDDDSMSSYGAGGKEETVQSEQITSAVSEERQRFVIRGVVDPRSGLTISLQDAVHRGIVDQSAGMYVNPNTGQHMSIPEAMNMGRIVVEAISTTKTRKKKKVPTATLR